jgi:hypothetical protein
MTDEQKSVEEQIAEAEGAVTRAREAGRELEEKEALERVAVLKGLHRGTGIEHADDQGHEDNKPRA